MESSRRDLSIQRVVKAWFWHGMGKSRLSSFCMWKQRKDMKFVTSNWHKTGKNWSYRGIPTSNGKLSARSIDSEAGQRLTFNIKWGKDDLSLIGGRIFDETKRKMVTKVAKHWSLELSFGGIEAARPLLEFLFFSAKKTKCLKKQLFFHCCFFPNCWLVSRRGNPVIGTAQAR